MVGEILHETLKPKPIVIGIEGGPCAGKTTFINKINENAENINRPIHTIPEVASEHIDQLHASGKNIIDLAINNRPEYISFQSSIVGSIIDNINHAKNKLQESDAIIIIDRPDIGAYVSANEYKTILENNGEVNAPIHTLVDKLIYLPSVAWTNPEQYEVLRETNTARYEATVEDAQKVCSNNLSAIKTHPEIEIVWGGDFRKNIEQLCLTVLNPEQEKEIKLLADDKQANRILNVANKTGSLLHKMMIEQSYHFYEDIEFRLRRTICQNNILHYHLTTKSGEGIVRTETQRSINHKVYDHLKTAKQIGKTLQKLRYLILEPADNEGIRRQWFVDQYISPKLPSWHFETTVHDYDEVDKILNNYPNYRPTTESAKSLIFK